MPRLAALFLSAAAVAAPAFAQGGGKLLLTGGVSSIDGAAGGGLTPWAVTGSYATAGQVGATAFVTRVHTGDYGLLTSGVALGLHDRVELSLAKQEFYGSLAPLADLKITQDIVGIKVKLAGDAVYDQDRWLPQLAVGAMFKHNNGIGGLGTVTSVTTTLTHTLFHRLSSKAGVCA